jgi:hypothetical protein
VGILASPERTGGTQSPSSPGSAASVGERELPSADQLARWPRAGPGPGGSRRLWPQVARAVGGAPVRSGIKVFLAVGKWIRVALDGEASEGFSRRGHGKRSRPTQRSSPRRAIGHTSRVTAVIGSRRTSSQAAELALVENRRETSGAGDRYVRKRTVHASVVQPASRCPRQRCSFVIGDDKPISKRRMR